MRIFGFEIKRNHPDSPTVRPIVTDDWLKAFGRYASVTYSVDYDGRLQCHVRGYVNGCAVTGPDTFGNTTEDTLQKAVVAIEQVIGKDWRATLPAIPRPNAPCVEANQENS